MSYGITKQQLIELDVEPAIDRPHVFVLGAGASKAAFPQGDAAGRRLPLMADIVDVLGLKVDIQQAGYDAAQNFEHLYSHLHRLDPEGALLKLIEQAVMDYFSCLALPSHPTLYDVMLLSLREKDAIFTFNWDPFLADAYSRNYAKGRLPHIFHLHGNVRVAFCERCRLAMPIGSSCHRCDRPLQRTRLLYPVEEKNYSECGFISSQWQQARTFISRAFLITIFGYSAPTSDKEAMTIVREAWKGETPKDRLVERVEIIDIRDSEELASQWHPFSHFGHISFRRSVFESRAAYFPRRTCEALLQEGLNGNWVEPITAERTIEGILDVLPALAAAE